jgi:hypothetical protein
MFDRRDRDGLMKPQSDSSPLTTGESMLDGVKDLLRMKGFWIGVALFVVLAFLASNDVLEGSLLLIGVALLYFLPAVIARRKPNASSVLVINLFLGWTLIGWVVALAMAVNDPKPAVVAPQAAVAAAQSGRICPFCAEDIKHAAVVCKHCGRDLPSDG